MMASMEISAQEMNKRTRPPRKTAHGAAVPVVTLLELGYSCQFMTLSSRPRRARKSSVGTGGATTRYVPRPTAQADGGEAGIRPVHLLRRADQHQDQRRRVGHFYPADGRRDGPAHRLRAYDQGPGARVRERDGDEPLVPRSQRRQLPDQHLPPARDDLALHPLRPQPRSAVRGPEAAAGAAQPGHGEARP